MRYRRLGHSGLFVSEFCLGTMTFGGSDDMWGQIGTLQQEEANTLVRTALDAGINFIDTANIYANGRSEAILGQALKDLGVAREDVVIATKVHGAMGEGPNARGASRGQGARSEKWVPVFGQNRAIDNMARPSGATPVSRLTV